MADQPKKSRRSWTLDQKITFVKMRLTPVADGKIKSVNRFCKEHNIPIKTFYSWQMHYKKISSTEQPRIRKTIESKSRNPELITEVTELSLYHPDWSARTIIENLSAANNNVSIPTIQRILKAHDIGKLSKRFAHTESAYIKNKRVLPKETVNLLFRNNPNLNLYELTKNINGLVFFLKSLSLDYYFGSDSGYILVAVEVNSFYPFLYYWDGKKKHEATDFIDDVVKFADVYQEMQFYFEPDMKWPNKLFIPTDKDNIHLLDTSNEMYRWINPFFNKIKKEFLKKYKFTGTEQLRVALFMFANSLSIEKGPIGYPTWGNPPYKAIRNHKENISLITLNNFFL